MAGPAPRGTRSACREQIVGIGGTGAAPESRPRTRAGPGVRHSRNPALPATSRVVLCVCRTMYVPVATGWSRRRLPGRGSLFGGASPRCGLRRMRVNTIARVHTYVHNVRACVRSVPPAGPPAGGPPYRRLKPNSGPATRGEGEQRDSVRPPTTGSKETRFERTTRARLGRRRKSKHVRVPSPALRKRATNRVGAGGRRRARKGREGKGREAGPTDPHRPTRPARRIIPSPRGGVRAPVRGCPCFSLVTKLHRSCSCRALQRSAARPDRRSPSRSKRRRRWLPG